MKQLFTILCLMVVGLAAEAPGPYAPSGWRPAGPAFVLPQRVPQGQAEEYLPPPVDPRNLPRPNQEYGPPEVDVSVQGLPTQEQLPIFEGSPINGQQYVGPNFNSDIRSLDQSFKQTQIQQANYRQFARQQQLDAAQASTGQNQLTPRQLVQKTSPRPQVSTPNDAKTESTTEPISLNQGEELDEDTQPQKQNKITVEVSRQRLQEFPPELFLGPLAQQLQAQLVPFQFNQLSAPLILQPNQGAPQKQVAGYDAATHFAAFPSVLAQQQLANQVTQEQQGFPQAPTYLVPRGNDQSVQYPQDQQVQYQPMNQYAAQYPQFQMQPVFIQPQNQDQVNTQTPQQTSQDPAQPQFIYQYQPQVYQGIQTGSQPQDQTFIPPALQPGYPTYPVQGQEGTPQIQGQDGFLQSGFNVNQQGNGVETEEGGEEDDRATATAVATAFGARTQPRLNTKYGVPVPGPRFQGNGFQTTTDSTREETTEDGPTVADATAVAKDARKSAKLRNRRFRPVFTLDKSGHLVLAQEQ